MQFLFSANSRPQHIVGLLWFLLEHHPGHCLLVELFDGRFLGKARDTILLGVPFIWSRPSSKVSRGSNESM